MNNFLPFCQIFFKHLLVSFSIVWMETLETDIFPLLTVCRNPLCKRFPEWSISRTVCIRLCLTA